MSERMTARKRQALEMRSRIQSAALDLFDREGFENVSVEEIAQTAGCSVGNIYHYFKSKDELAIQVTSHVDDAYSELEEAYLADTARMRDGEPCDLLDRLAADPAFGMTRPELDRLMDPARLTASIIRFSVARKGIYSRMVLSTTFSLTRRPLVTFWARRRMASAHKKPSGIDRRRLAESSRVRSIHWTEAVMGAFMASAMR